MRWKARRATREPTPHRIGVRGAGLRGALAAAGYALCLLAFAGCGAPEQNIYIAADDGSMYSLRATDGSVRWRTSIVGNAETPVLSGGVLYVSAISGGSPYSSVYALRSGDGKQLWRYQALGQFFSRPVIAGGDVYVSCGNASGDGFKTTYLYALDIATGHLRWRFPIQADVCSRPVVTGQAVYFNANDGFLYALRAGDGHLLWRHQLGSPAYEMGGQEMLSPLVAGDAVYAATEAGAQNAYLYALEAMTGKARWVDDAPYALRPTAVIGGTLYVSSSGSALYALRTRDGGVAARYDQAPVAETVQALAIDQHLAYIWSSGDTGERLDAVRMDAGTIVWRVPISVYGVLPVVTNGVIFGVGQYGAAQYGRDGPPTELFAIQASTGRVLWRFRPPEGIWALPTVAGGVVYAPTHGTAVYALRATDGKVLWRKTTGGSSFDSPVAGP